MPDITMCGDNTCPLCLECYRFLASPDKYRQLYFAKSPRNGNVCHYFSDINWKPLKNNVNSRTD